jgi:single-stranded-DNA-specific exonuclease
LSRSEAPRGILSAVVEPRYRWQFPEPVEPSAELRAAGLAHGLSERVVAILATRGVADPTALEAFLGPPSAGLHDPSLLPDAGPAVARISRAARDGERTMVFGDFDADGLTGLAILTRALGALGIAVTPYVPSRLEEGHGLSLAAVDAAAAEGISLIVTVDCGTTSHAEIAAARSRGIDVIVTDHHRVPETLPEAIAVVNPHRPDSIYLDRRLSGSGVAFTLARLLLAELPDGPRIALGLADLATIGTVADLAPVLGENRAIARLGLDILRSGPRPGIAALLARAGVASAAVDLETVAFALAPRLNAAGRVGEAAEAAALLLTDDPAEAATLAEALEAANLTRRDLTRGAMDEARAALGEAVASSSAVVVRGPWPVGIVGLVAARLAEETGRPAVVGAELGAVVRASCRSGGGVDLAATLERCGDLLLRHGGHAGAAGFEIAADRWDAFRERFEGLSQTDRPADGRPALQVDLALPARTVDYALLRELRRLAPTGPGNPEPLVAILGLTVARVRAVNGGHTQLTLRRDPDVLDAIAFGRDDLPGLLTEGERVDVVARLASRAFGGFESLQLEVRDVAPSGSHPAAAAVLAGAAGIPSLAGTTG